MVPNNQLLGSIAKGISKRFSTERNGNEDYENYRLTSILLKHQPKVGHNYGGTRSEAAVKGCHAS